MDDARGVTVSLLGELQITTDLLPPDDKRIPSRERALLARLAIDTGRVVGADRLIDDLWGDNPASGARNTLQVYVSHLRRRLGAELIRSSGAGYVLALAPGSVDAYEFTNLVSSGARLIGGERAGEAVEVFDRALRLWRGEPLNDLHGYEFARVEATRLSEVRATALQHLAEALLARGDHDRVVEEFAPLVKQYPYRERLRGAVMVGLYRQGRGIEALQLYAEARVMLRDELGLDPGPVLQALQSAILADDPKLIAAAPQAQRVGGVAAPPVPSTQLLGRTREVAAITELLARPDVRLVSVLGVGGAGKTRLVLEVVRADTPGVAVWVPLVGLSKASDVLPAVGAALRLQGPDIDADHVASAFAGAPTLLVLDNAEHLLPDIAQVVAGLLAACPQLTVLMTSRVAAHLGAEHRFLLAPLEVPGPETDLQSLERNPAVALFTQRAAQVRRGFTLDAHNAAAVAGICARLDGLPLALELAAARIGLLDPDAVLVRLESRLGLLTAEQIEADRHRSLRATLDWSYRLLSPGAASLLNMLAVFRGGLTLDSAENLVRLAAADDLSTRSSLDADGSVMDALQELVDASLVARDPRESGRFVMLETVAEYAGERLAESGIEALVRDAHCEHFRAAVARLWPRMPRWPRTVAEADWYVIEQHNLRSAIEWAIDRRHAVALADLATGTYGHWVYNGRWPQLKGWLELVARDPDAGVRIVDAEAILAALALRTSTTDEGRDHIERALAHLRGHPEEPGRLAIVLACLSAIAHAAGQDEEAARHGMRAMEAAEAADDPDTTAIVLLNSCLSFEIGHAAERDNLMRAKQIAARTGNDQLTIGILNNLADNALTAGDTKEAIARSAEALRHDFMSRQPALSPQLLNIMAGALLLDGNREKARPVLRQALDLAQRGSLPWLASESLLFFAALAAAEGDLGSAAVLLGSHDTMLRALGQHRVDSSAVLYDRFLADLEQRLGAAEFQAGLRLGELLTPGQLADWLVNDTLLPVNVANQADSGLTPP